MQAIDEAMDHVELLSAINEAVELATSKIEEEREHERRIMQEKMQEIEQKKREVDKLKHLIELKYKEAIDHDRSEWFALKEKVE